MFTFILLFLSLSVLILAHEWGHFFSARKFGVKVEEFGFGFPPKIYSFLKSGVRYSINLLPLGGFVKIFGEQGEGEGDHESFVSRPVWQRFIILAAGVGMNFVLAWVFFSLGAAFGLPQVYSDSSDKLSKVPVSIIGLVPNSPAEKVGFRAGDQILGMKVFRTDSPSAEVSLRIESEQDVQNFVDAYRGEEITLEVRRGESIEEIKVTPRVAVPEGEGPLGVALGRIILKRTVWFLAPWEGLKTLGTSIVLIAQGFGLILKDLIFEGRTSAAVSGPVGIFFFAQDSRSLGISYFLQFIGIISVNLAILNFLPIPALDGGRILFLLIEKIRGRRINLRVESLVHTIGFVALIFLMMLVTYKDIARIL
jgi:regulator of sigma E protease